MRKGNELKENYGTQTVYDIDDFPVYLRLKNLHRIPGQATTLHWHEDVEYILAIKGTVKCHVDGQAIFIKAGEGLFINARQPHVFCAGDEKENLIQLVQILPSYMEALPAVKEKYIDKITENAAMPWLHLKPETLWQKEILLVLKTLPDWYASPAAPLRIASAFSEIWALLYENTGNYAWKAEEDQRFHQQMLLSFFFLVSDHPDQLPARIQIVRECLPTAQYNGHRNGHSFILRFF